MSHQERGPFVCILAALAYGAMLVVAKVLPRYDCIVLVVLLVLVFHRLDAASARGRKVGLYGVTAVLLGAFLLHLWTIGYEGRNAVFGGILPWSDSNDYYDDALRLLHGARFLEVGSKRPLFSVALSALLRVTGGDLRVALVVFALVGAWATAAAAIEVWKTHGFRSALVVYLALLFIERRWTGFVQTEHIGLPVGALAFVLVWRAYAVREDRLAHVHARRLVLAALFALTLALVARTGSFFVLPAVAIWAARTFLPRDGRRRAAFLGASAAVVVAGFGLNRAVVATCGSGALFSDYPGIVYGAMHGEGFNHLTEKHPDLLALPIERRVGAAWSVVLGEARARPMLLAGALARSGAGLFASPYGAFSYVWTNPDDHVLESGRAVRESMKELGPLGPLVLWKRERGLYSLLNAGAMGLIGVALLVYSLLGAWSIFVRRRDDPSLSLLRWTFGGILLSAPFLPPSITSGQQTQTATMAFFAAVPAVVFLTRGGQEGRERPSPLRSIYGMPLVVVPLVIGAGLAAIVVWMRVDPLVPPACASSTSHVVRVFPRSGFVVARARSYGVGTVAESDLRDSLPLLRKHNGSFVRSLEPFLAPGTHYVAAFDACDCRAKVLVDDSRALPPSVGAGTWTEIAALPMAASAVLYVGAAVPEALAPQRPVLP